MIFQLNNMNNVFGKLFCFYDTFNVGAPVMNILILIYIYLNFFYNNNFSVLFLVRTVTRIIYLIK